MRFPALLTLAAIACRPPAPAWEPKEPSPLITDFTTDDARAASEEVTAGEGGFVTVTAADGTVFELSIPPGAVTSDETITLTPITAVSAVGGDFDWGVNIEPTGILFLQQPELTVTVNGERPPDTMTGFSIRPPPGRGGFMGEVGHMPLNISDGSGGKTTIFTPIYDGSPQGSTRGGSGGLGTPTGRADQATRDIAKAIEAARATGELPIGAMEDILDGWSKSMDGDLNGLKDNPSNAERLIRELMRWWKLVEQNGLEDGKLKDAFQKKNARLTAAIKAALEASKKRCLDKMNAQLAVFEARKMLALVRLIDSLGLDTGDLASDKLIAAYQGCLTFELKLQSRMRLVASEHHVAAEREATITIALGEPPSPGPMTLTGSGPLTLKGTPMWVDVDTMCSETFTRGVDTTLDVIRADLNFDLQQSPLQKVSMAIFPQPGDKEFFLIACPTGQAETLPASSEFWHSGFTWNYVPDHLKPPKPGMYVEAWAPGLAPVYATKQYDRAQPHPAGSYEELSTYTLTHKPVQPP